MGLIQAAVGSVAGSLADQWKDFLTVPADIGPTAALFPAVPVGTNADRGSNTRASRANVSNGSKIVVPEGYGLMIFQDGALTAFVDVAGAYIWNAEDVNSQSIFAGDKWTTSLINQSWERFKYGGRPSAQQLALFVSLKELPNNKFGTQSVIYWDDAYLKVQAGALAHGVYSLSIVDPILFAKRFVPASYLQAQGVFDFTDKTNPAAIQLFSEVVGSLSAAFSLYSNSPDRANRMARIQQDAVGFAKSISEAVDAAYEWRAARGLEISKATIIGVKYDDSTAELLKTVQRADALSGSRGNSNLQASIAAGIEAAGSESGANGILGLGLAGGALGLGSLVQPTSSDEKSGAGAENVLKKLELLKQAREAGLISNEDYEAAKAKVLALL
jgi:membrane protease subunit (stomatin/prohibitin family)